ncbi:MULTISPECIES: DUF6130 family protein [Sphingomonas]|jgi:Family of unknown function (DUF6130)|uniref:DUF6130 family protein n=1 Tax=Sphingomonas TaxID=13687 RepID=UPI002FF36F2F
MVAMSCVTASPVRLSARDAIGAAGVIPVTSEPPARLVVDPPLAAPLSQGLLVVQYRAENVRIVPVYGPAALDVSPRIGHLHLTLDDLPWHWVDASGEPIIIQYLPAGPHSLLIELVDANHNPFDSATIAFTIGERETSIHDRPGQPAKSR